MKKSESNKKYGKALVEAAELEPIPFPLKEPATMIYFTCPEGTSLCPRSGFPDFWTAHIWYVPDRAIVELKSLKLYLNKFRDRGIYHEELPHVLVSDFRNVLNPQYIKIVVDYTRRGNIQTDVMLEYQIKNYRGPTAPAWPIRFNHR